MIYECVNSSRWYNWLVDETNDGRWNDSDPLIDMNELLIEVVGTVTLYPQYCEGKDILMMLNRWWTYKVDKNLAIE